MSRKINITHQSIMSEGRKVFDHHGLKNIKQIHEATKHITRDMSPKEYKEFHTAIINSSRAEDNNKGKIG